MASATEAPVSDDPSCPVLAATTELNAKMAERTELQDPVKQGVANAPTMIKLNLGGTIFAVSKDTLLRAEGSYFHALLGSGHWKPDDNTTNAYFLDLDPTLFHRVLFYLRTGTMMPMDGMSKADRDELMAMMEYLKVCPWEVGTQLVRWNAANKASTVTLSNECRTVEKTTYKGSGGAIATEALDGTFRIRIDKVASTFYLGVRSMTGFRFHPYDCHNWPHHSYCLDWSGHIHTMQWQPQQLPHLRVGDVVTIQRRELEVIFTVNDGVPARVPLAYPREELFPIVVMRTMSVGTKLTILD